MDMKTDGRCAGRGNLAPGTKFVRSLLLIALGLTVVLEGCSAAKPASPTPTSPPVVIPADTPTATPIPTALPTEAAPTSTASPSPTVTLPFSAVVAQALKDSFNCITNNMTYAPSISLTAFCPGYWDSTTSNMYTLDGVVVRKDLEPYLTPLSSLRWRLVSVTNVVKDESLSTTVNPIYTATLSTILTGDITLKCPTGTPAPFQTSVSIPINGQARISVINYLNQAQETIQIESWNIKTDPLKDYCATLH
jgi:hypothetical protein